MELRAKVQQMIRRGNRDSEIVIYDDGNEIGRCHITDYREIGKDKLNSECTDLRDGSGIITADNYKTSYYIEIVGV